MKMSPSEVKNLCRQITQLLETEEWVLSFGDRRNNKLYAHSMSGLIKPVTLETLINNLYWMQKKHLMDIARNNFP